VVYRESKVLVADPEVFRKCTREPHGNATKKEKQLQTKEKKKTAQSLQHGKSKQLSQDITTEAEYYNISRI